jgi:hypothetical protein
MNSIEKPFVVQETSYTVRKLRNGVESFLFHELIPKHGGMLRKVAIQLLEDLTAYNVIHLRSGVAESSISIIIPRQSKRLLIELFDDENTRLTPLHIARGDSREQLFEDEERPILSRGRNSVFYDEEGRLDSCLVGPIPFNPELGAFSISEQPVKIFFNPNGTFSLTVESDRQNCDWVERKSFDPAREQYVDLDLFSIKRTLLYTYTFSIEPSSGTDEEKDLVIKVKHHLTEDLKIVRVPLQLSRLKAPSGDQRTIESLFEGDIESLFRLATHRFVVECLPKPDRYERAGQ